MLSYSKCIILDSPAQYSNSLLLSVLLLNCITTTTLPLFLFVQYKSSLNITSINKTSTFGHVLIIIIHLFTCYIIIMFPSLIIPIISTYIHRYQNHIINQFINYNTVILYQVNYHLQICIFILPHVSSFQSPL